jgi:hypothetical protein
MVPLYLIHSNFPCSCFRHRFHPCPPAVSGFSDADGDVKPEPDKVIIIDARYFSILQLNIIVEQRFCNCSKTSNDEEPDR